MDTGEFIALDHGFTEANKAYRKLLDKARYLTRAMINHTTTIHNTYHKKVKGGWSKCNRAICRHTQFMIEYEGFEFE